MDGSLPIIDVSSLIQADGNPQLVADQLHRACTETGFFYISGHGVDIDLQEKLEKQSKEFFELELAAKMKINMPLGGKAWRGYFPVGDELTSGKPDLKEGLYFGTELNEKDPRVQAGLPLHGANLFLASMPQFKDTVLNYMEALTKLGHCLMRGIAMSLGLDQNFFARKYMQDPLCLFRIFHYPAYHNISEEEFPWGVGEHTDYGMLTMLKQDDKGGLQVKSKSGWMEAPYIENTFICNIGDMLDRMTGGYYRSTPHRVRNRSKEGRLSFPFFFDPAWEARIEPIDLAGVNLPDDDHKERWDQASVHLFEGTYGEYILAKVARVFPELKKNVRKN